MRKGLMYELAMSTLEISVNLIEIYLYPFLINSKFP